MAVTAFWFARAFLRAFNSEFDFNDVAMQVTLHTSTYTPNQDTHDYYDDLTNELNGNGYTLGGYVLANKAGPVQANNVISFDNTVDPVWTADAGQSLVARRSVYFQNTAGVGSTDPLMCWVDFGQDETASNLGTFTLAINAGGIATITAADATGFP